MPKTKGNGAKAREKNKKAPGKPYEVPTPRPSVSQKDADQDELYTCDKCKGSSEYVLQCECCCSWFCNVCCDIPEDLFNGISGIKSLHWFCTGCDGSVIGIISKSTGSGSIGEVIDSAIHKSLDKAMGQFIEVLTEKTKQFQQAIQTSIPTVEAMDASDVPSGSAPAPIPAHRSVVAAVDEYVDRERRKKNLIIHNLPEPSDCPDTQRLTNDLQQVSSLLTSEFGVPENVASKPTRLGAPKANKPRLLRVEIGDLAAKREILRNATKLRASSKWSNVYVSPDLTLKEREQSKQLREELRARKASGEKDLYIKFGRIVPRPPRLVGGTQK